MSGRAKTDCEGRTVSRETMFSAGRRDPLAMFHVKRDDRFLGDFDRPGSKRVGARCLWKTLPTDRDCWRYGWHARRDKVIHRSYPQDASFHVKQRVRGPVGLWMKALDCRPERVDAGYLIAFAELGMPLGNPQGAPSACG